MQDIKSYQKRMGKNGQTTNTVNFLIGALVLVVLATSLGPEMFDNIDDLSPVFNESNSSQCLENCDNEDTPTWVPTVLYVIVGAGLIFLIWRAFGNK